MRKVLMIGTHVAQPPYAVGVRVWVDELTAYVMGRITPTPEITYADARDTVSDARAAALQHALAVGNARLWAEKIGPTPTPAADRYVGVPPDGQASYVTDMIQPPPSKGY